MRLNRRRTIRLLAITFAFAMTTATACSQWKDAEANAAMPSEIATPVAAASAAENGDGGAVSTSATAAASSGTERYSIYSWWDDAGVAHYTNELSEVPEPHRSSVATVIKDWVAPELPPEPARAETSQDAEPAPRPTPAAVDVARPYVGQETEVSRDHAVAQDTQVITQQPIIVDDTLIGAGGAPSSFGRNLRGTEETFLDTGPSPRNAAGASPRNAAGASPQNAAGASPLGSAGRSPFAAAGPPPRGVGHQR
jgi:hypothetical protein